MATKKQKPVKKQRVYLSDRVVNELMLGFRKPVTVEEKRMVKSINAVKREGLMPYIPVDPQG